MARLELTDEDFPTGEEEEVERTPDAGAQDLEGRHIPYAGEDVDDGDNTEMWRSQANPYKIYHRLMDKTHPFYPSDKMPGVCRVPLLFLIETFRFLAFLVVDFLSWARFWKNFPQPHWPATVTAIWFAMLFTFFVTAGCFVGFLVPTITGDFNIQGRWTAGFLENAVHPQGSMTKENLGQPKIGYFIIVAFGLTALITGFNLLFEGQFIRVYINTRLANGNEFLRHLCTMFFLIFLGIPVMLIIGMTEWDVIFLMCILIISLYWLNTVNVEENRNRFFDGFRHIFNHQKSGEFLDQTVQTSSDLTCFTCGGEEFTETTTTNLGLAVVSTATVVDSLYSNVIDNEHVSASLRKKIDEIEVDSEEAGDTRKSALDRAIEERIKMKANTNGFVHNGRTFLTELFLWAVMSSVLLSYYGSAMDVSNDIYYWYFHLTFWLYYAGFTVILMWNTFIYSRNNSLASWTSRNIINIFTFRWITRSEQPRDESEWAKYKVVDDLANSALMWYFTTILWTAISLFILVPSASTFNQDVSPMWF